MEKWLGEMEGRVVKAADAKHCAVLSTVQERQKSLATSLCEAEQRARAHAEQQRDQHRALRDDLSQQIAAVRSQVRRALQASMCNARRAAWVRGKGGGSEACGPFRARQQTQWDGGARSRCAVLAGGLDKAWKLTDLLHVPTGSADDGGGGDGGKAASSSQQPRGTYPVRVLFFAFLLPPLPPSRSPFP